MSETPLSRKKILFVLPSLMSGGAERVLITLMNSLPRDLYDPVFLSIIDKGELGDIIATDIPQYCLKRNLNAKVLPSVFKKIKSLEPDVIVSTMAHMNFTIMVLRPFLPRHIRFVVREAITPSFFFNKHPRIAPILKGFYKLLYPRADMVVSPSRIIFDEFEAFLSMRDDNFFHLPNPVDEKNMRESVTQNSFDDLKFEGLNLVACGRLSHQKGFDRLIQSLNKIDMPGAWRLHIIGEGEKRGELQDMIDEYGLGEHVKLLGLIRKPYVHFAAADCFLMPSRYEGLPNVALESLACGTKVIATTQSGGIAEIANNATDDDVVLAQTMKNFEEKILALRPLMKKEIAQSILPPLYKKENITAMFIAKIRAL